MPLFPHVLQVPFILMGLHLVRSFFKCSSPHLASSLSELACRGDHEHAVTQGSFTAPSANYTPKLAQHYFTGLDRHNTATLAMPAAASAIAGVAPVLDVPDDGELTISRNDALKAIATSTNHLLTHYPKNPFCEHCNLAKQRRFGHRARKAPLERSEAFGDRVLLDTIIATRSAPGFDGSTICHALQDDCTAICAAYPRDSRGGDALQVCLRSFLGGAIAASNTVCSDQAGEIISACSSLGINHLATTPHDSESHGRQEAFNQRLINVTRVPLLLPVCLQSFGPLPQSMQHLLSTSRRVMTKLQLHMKINMVTSFQAIRCPSVPLSATSLQLAKSLNLIAAELLAFSLVGVLPLVANFRIMLLCPCIILSTKPTEQSSLKTLFSLLNGSFLQENLLHKHLHLDMRSHGPKN